MTSKRILFRMALGLGAVLLAISLAGCSLSGELPGSSSVALTIKDSTTGQIIPQASVTLGDQNQATSTGRLTFHELQPGTYTVIARSDGYNQYTGKIVVEKSSSSMIVTLTKSSGTPPPQPPDQSKTLSLTGTITDNRSGLKIWSGTVEIGNKKVDFSKGKYTISGIAPGTYSVTVRARNYYSSTKPVTLTKDGQILDIAIGTFFPEGDLDLLARLVRAEAGGENYVGKVAVAASVINRVYSSDYPNTIRGVVLQVYDGRYYQYEPVMNGSINLPADSESKAAVWDALAGWDPSYGATGFYNPAKTTNQWVRSRPVTVVIGNHTFFI